MIKIILLLTAMQMDNSNKVLFSWYFYLDSKSWWRIFSWFPPSSRLAGCPRYGLRYEWCPYWTCVFIQPLLCFLS